MNKNNTKYNPLCEEFQKISKRTWNIMHNNLTLPIAVREDGITALNLQDLIKIKSNKIRIFDFTPQIESSQTGADWEWWFIQPGYCFGTAVQAKRLSKKSVYDVGYKKGSQIKLLLNYCKSNNITPMYCFYSWWNRPPYKHWPCGSYLEHNYLWGCSLADGYAIWKLHLQKKHKLSDIHKYTMPWHCIACCPKHIDGGPIGTATRAAGISVALRDNILYELDSKEFPKDDEFPDYDLPQVRQSLPDRISALLELSEEDLNYDFIRHYFGEYPPAHIVLQGNFNEVQDDISANIM